MSCLGNNYDPVPTREWSRVENICVYTTPDEISLEPVYFAPLKIYINAADVVDYYQMIKKGNILQYKQNSSNLTKTQRYSQIAKGQWTNRTKTWATQGQDYSNPNNNSLKRVGQTTISLETGLPSFEPITCPQPVVNIYPQALPSRSTNPLPNEPIIPPLNKSGSINPFPPIIQVPTKKVPIIIPEGGNLIYNVVENPCTGESVAQPAPSNCYLTSASDVPGPEQLLCYRSSLPTYYPKSRTTMSNSTNKWPVNAKLIRSTTNGPVQTTNTKSNTTSINTTSINAISSNAISSNAISINAISSNAISSNKSITNSNTKLKTINLVGNNYVISNPGIYNIIKTNLQYDTITLSSSINNLSIIIIINETNDLLNVESGIQIYNNTFSPSGELTVQMPVHTMGQFTMIRTLQGNNYWQAVIH